MKTVLAGIGASLAASACCIGPVAMSLLGAGALGAAAVQLEPLRPWFIAATAMLIGVAFFRAYRTAPAGESCGDGACSPRSRRGARLLAWTAVPVAGALIAFPYYIGWLI
jgi:mercuric ion transport protein